MFCLLFLDFHLLYLVRANEAALGTKNIRVIQYSVIFRIGIDKLPTGQFFVFKSSWDIPILSELS